MIALRFNYKNHRGEEHQYVIEPHLNRLFSEHDDDAGERSVVINGFLIERDGDPRADLGAQKANRRRSFNVLEMRDIEAVNW